MRLLALTMLLFPALPAAAEEMLVGAPCAGAADCPSGFTCEAVAADCGVPEACACPTCPPGVECPPCNCEEEAPAPSCGTENRCVFVPETCSPGTACSMAGFVCVEYAACGGSAGDCACPGCPEGERCPPCDCGEEDPEPADCGIDVAYCLPDEIVCSTDADCTGGWVCSFLEENDAACMSCDCGPGEADCRCEPCDEGDYEVEGRCLPPGWEAQVRASAVGMDDDAAMELGGALGEGSGGASGCSAAGGGAASLLSLGLLAAALRRRRARQ